MSSVQVFRKIASDFDVEYGVYFLAKSEMIILHFSTVLKYH